MNQANQTAHPIDLHVGRLVRRRRNELGLNQQRLAEALSVTFQQVQKYELGCNRISASKLFEISKFLQTPIAFFFDGIGSSHEVSADFEAGVLSLSSEPTESEKMELALAFTKIKSPKVRRNLLELIKSFAKD